MNTLVPKTILSARRAKDSEGEARERHKLLCEQLRQAGYAFVQANGVWNGETEQSVLVLTYDPDAAVKIAWQWEQEAVLHVDANGLAWLEYRDGRTEEVGQWREVPGYDTIGVPGYTRVGNRYFVAG